MAMHNADVVAFVRARLAEADRDGCAGWGEYSSCVNHTALRLALLDAMAAVLEEHAETVRGSGIVRKLAAAWRDHADFHPEWLQAA